LHLPFPWATVFAMPTCSHIRAILFGLFLLAVSPAFAQPAGVHHRLSVSLDPKTHRLRATDIFTLDPDVGRCFRLTPGATISKALIDGKAVDFSFRNGRLCLLAASTPVQAETISISYEAVFDDPVPQNPVHSEDPSYGVTGTIRPEGTLLLGGAGWYVRLPGTATFTLEVKAPEGYEAATAGKCRNRETRNGSSRSVWEIDAPLPNLALSAGPYVIQERRVGDTALYTYFHAENQSLSDAYLEATAEYIRLYNDLIGPYPFGKFAVVENFFPTGYGFPSYTLLGSRVLRLPFMIETSLGHEIAHSWWGNCVRVDYEKGNWSEGVTTYVADHLYKERSSPEEGRDYRLKILRDYATLVPPEKDFALRDFVSRVNPETRVIGYGKSAMVFHMARRRLGDEDFWKALGTIYSEKRFQKASWNDFAAIMSRVGGSDLRPFFDQWVDRPGAPVLRLADISAQQKGDAWIVQGVIVQEKPVYTLSVPVQMNTPSGPMYRTVDSSSLRTPFAFHTPHSPTRLEVDPQADLFRRLFPAEVPATVNSLKASERLTVIFAEGLSSEMRAAGKVLLQGLGQGDAVQRTEKPSGSAPTKDRDLLFVGLPEHKDWLPSFPKGLRHSDSGLAVKDRLVDPRSDAACVVYSDRKSGGVVGLFVAPPSYAGAVARKISHYGKYSYLVFEETQNTLKGIWSTEQSPLVHHF